MFGANPLKTLESAKAEGSSAFVTLKYDEARRLGSRARRLITAVRSNGLYTTMWAGLTVAVTAAIEIAVGHPATLTLAAGQAMGCVLVSTASDYVNATKASKQMIGESRRPKKGICGLPSRLDNN